MEVEVESLCTHLAYVELVDFAVGISELHDALPKVAKHVVLQTGQTTPLGIKYQAILIHAQSVLHNSIRTALHTSIGIGVELRTKKR